MKVIIEGIDAVVRGENAMIIKERLESFLAPTQRQNEDAA